MPRLKRQIMLEIAEISSGKPVWLPRWVPALLICESSACRQVASDLPLMATLWPTPWPPKKWRFARQELPGCSRRLPYQVMFVPVLPLPLQSKIGTRERKCIYNPIPSQVSILLLVVSLKTAKNSPPCSAAQCCYRASVCSQVVKRSYGIGLSAQSNKVDDTLVIYSAFGKPLVTPKQ
ncbi:hypothetical protein DFS34DRAFT_44723 [Phlyctochytrium arcticum]|nr:hypothetical protein DFS34DRAFT_44723 [Phlyctochytrium arcticum]